MRTPLMCEAQAAPVHMKQPNSVQRLNYKQLCSGSILGLVCGTLLGKLSGVLAYFACFGFLAWRWLQSRQLVSRTANPFLGVAKYTKGLFAGFIANSDDSESLPQWLTDMDSLCFNVSFAATFALAAINV